MQDTVPKAALPVDSTVPGTLPAGGRSSRFRLKLLLVSCVLIAGGLLLWTIHRRSNPPHPAVDPSHDLSKWMNYSPPVDQIVFFHDKSDFFGGACTSEATSLMKTSQFNWNKTLVLCRDHTELDSCLTSIGAKRNVFRSNEDPDAVLFCGNRACAVGERFLVVNSLDSGKWLPNRARQRLFVSLLMFFPSAAKTGRSPTCRPNPWTSTSDIFAIKPATSCAFSPGGPTQRIDRISPSPTPSMINGESLTGI